MFKIIAIYLVKKLNRQALIENIYRTNVRKENECKRLVKESF